MNGNYFQNPAFPSGTVTQITPPGNALNEKYVSYPESSAWQNKIYDGIIEEAGRDHLIIRDIKNDAWYLIRMIYLNYVEFEERINYVNKYSENLDY